MSDPYGIGEYFDYAPSTTNTLQYFEPLRADIEWWDLKQLEQVHSYSSWNPRGVGISNYIPILEANVSPPGTSQYGQFFFRVWDTDKVIDQQNTIRRKGIVIIKVKKYKEEPYSNLMYGFITKVRPQTIKNQLYYYISGIGSGILLNERFINIRRTARMKAINSDIPLFDDELMQVRRLYKEILTNKNVYVLDDIPIAEHFNPPMDCSGLDTAIVNDTVLALNEPYVQASHALNAMLDGVGADGGIDAYNKPYLTYPLSRTPAITLKKWDVKTEQSLDSALSTAYFMEDWDWEMDWSQESGFANRLLAKSRVTSGVSTASTNGSYAGFESLIDVDHAQLIPASPARFRDLAVIVTRVGEGTINPNTKTLHGHIVQDNNNTPTGPVVALFDIPLASIPEDNPTPMFLSNLNFKRAVDPSRAHWIILYERGNPGLPDTVNWYYNTDEELTGTIARRSRVVGSPWTQDHNNNSGWEVTQNNSFNFAFSVLDNFTHIIVAEDVDSQERYGIVEDLVDVSWTTNTIAANKALGELLAVRCLPKITYNTNKVTIPNKLYSPGLIIRIEDALSGLISSAGSMAEITNASYSFGGASTEQNLGCVFADVSLVGHYDFKLEEENIQGGGGE